MLLTCCKNCSLKPALRGFFLTGGTVGAAAVAAAAKVGNPAWDVGGCLVTTDESVADADDGSLVVFVLDTSFHLILRGCLSSPSGLDNTLFASSQSAAVAWPRFLRDLDDITNSPVLSCHTAELGRSRLRLLKATMNECWLESTSWAD